MLDSSEDAGESVPDPMVKQACQHTPCHKSEDGQMQGSWVELRVESITYVACNFCGVQFGAVANANDEAVR